MQKRLKEKIKKYNSMRAEELNTPEQREENRRRLNGQPPRQQASFPTESNSSRPSPNRPNFRDGEDVYSWFRSQRNNTQSQSIQQVSDPVPSSDAIQEQPSTMTKNQKPSQTKPVESQKESAAKP